MEESNYCCCSADADWIECGRQLIPALQLSVALLAGRPNLGFVGLEREQWGHIVRLRARTRAEVLYIKLCDIVIMSGNQNDFMSTVFMWLV